VGVDEMCRRLRLFEAAAWAREGWRSRRRATEAVRRASVCVKLRNGECIKAEPVRCRGCILLTGVACTFPSTPPFS
jgi:hypothetical protein